MIPTKIKCLNIYNLYKKHKCNNKTKKCSGTLVPKYNPHLNLGNACLLWSKLFLFIFKLHYNIQGSPEKIQCYRSNNTPAITTVTWRHPLRPESCANCCV